MVQRSYTHVTAMCTDASTCRLHQEFGDTPLHWAYRSKATECIDILLAAGADPEVNR